MRKLFVLMTAAAIAIATAIAVIAITSPSSAEADDQDVPEVAVLQDEPSEESDGAAEGDAESESSQSRSGVIEDVLDELVADDVITRDQADAVSDAIRERLGDRLLGDHFRFHGPHGLPHFEEFPDMDRLRERLHELDELPELDELRERFGDFRFELRGLGAHLEAILDVLGGDLEAIIEGLMDGKTLAEIAEENGASGQDLVDAIVDAARERIDDAVAEERLTEEEADELLGEITESAEAFVNGDIGMLGRGFGFRFPGRGFGGFSFDDDFGGEDALFRIGV